MRPLLILFFVAAGLPSLGAEELLLDQATQLALAHNRGVANAGLDAAKAGDRLAAARTQQFPSVNFYALGAQQLNTFSFTFERGLLGTFPGTGPVPAEDTRVSTPLRPTGFLVGRISQPLSSLYRIRLKLGLLELNTKLAREQTRAEKQAVVRDVRRAYYGLQQVEASLQTVQETLKLYRELDTLTANYVKQEVALKGDLLEVETRLARTEQTELTLRNQQASGKEQLNQLLGRDVLMDFTVTPPEEADAYDLDLAGARQKALEQRPEIREARLKRQQAQQDLRAKRAEYIPDLSVDFNNLTLLNFSNFLPVHINSVGFSLSWEPFDWGRKKQEVTEKRRTIEQADNSLADAESLVVIDVNTKHRQLAQTRAQLRVSHLALQTALENLRVI